MLSLRCSKENFVIDIILNQKKKMLSKNEIYTQYPLLYEIIQLHLAMLL